jgi:hypothetical protein
MHLCICKNRMYMYAPLPQGDATATRNQLMVPKINQFGWFYPLRLIKFIGNFPTNLRSLSINISPQCTYSYSINRVEETK